MVYLGISFLCVLGGNFFVRVKKQSVKKKTKGLGLLLRNMGKNVLTGEFQGDSSVLPLKNNYIIPGQYFAYFLILRFAVS